MSDTISRQDAAKAIAQDIISKAIDEGWSDYTIAREAAFAAINALPAAPDRAAIIEECRLAVARQVALNVQARIDRADDTLAFEFKGLGDVMDEAIRALAD